MAQKRKTVGQERAERAAKTAERVVETRSGGDRIDQLLNKLNKSLDGKGRIMRSSEIEKREWARRSSGILSLDVVLNGGLPRGGLVELGGPFSSGKTSMALKCCAHEQQQRGGAIAWIALEPFSKRWARELGLFIPFSEETRTDPSTGELVPIDSFNNASDLEKLRMEQNGITDPYTEVSPFVLVQEERGDVALDISLELLRSNEFAIIVVDSLGVAKNTKWLEEGDVQSFADYPREPKMIGDYTSRALLSLNARYDETNAITLKGERYNETSVIHINQIVTAVGTQARSPWKIHEIKGGEANKHNHHAIVFVWRTQREDQRVEWEQGKNYSFAQEVHLYGLKSKLGPPFLTGEVDFYLQDYQSYHAGDFDVVRDVVTWALVARMIERNGAWFSLEDGRRFQGRQQLEEALRGDPEQVMELYNRVIQTMRQ